MIGDDEHGWSDSGVFNFEGGCYAKCIRLSREDEPQIWNAIHFGTVLENVTIDPETRLLDFRDDSLTETTRAAYPVMFIPIAVIPGVAGHPSHILFLTCDAFEVLPPIARLSTEQAMYQFLSGYTAKVVGIERGLGPKPKATFSTCFGAPFLILHPRVYADMLGERIARYRVQCWLVNAGWGGGSYGTGQRIRLAHTRAMLRAALEGRLADAPSRLDPVFGLHVPTACPDVPAEILLPRGNWPDQATYDTRAGELARLFQKNFEQFVDVPRSIRDTGPRPH